MKYLAFPVLLILVTSCNHTFREFERDAFASTFMWQRSHAVIFKPLVEDPVADHTMTVMLRHMHGMMVKEIPFTVKITDPSGKTRIIPGKFTIRNSEGDHAGDCAGDLCDVETVIGSDFRFDPAGTYHVAISHTLPLDQITGVMEVGLMIDKTNKD